MTTLRAILLGLTIGVPLGTCSACGPAHPEPARTGCETRVSFSDETGELGEAALARINAATGCEIEADADGIPVDFVEQLWNEDGTPACGQTTIGRYADGSVAFVSKIEIATQVEGCNSAEAIIVHEIFHAMIATNDTHARHGVFHAVSGNGESIDEATLETVCAHMACPVFSPEP